MSTPVLRILGVACVLLVLDGCRFFVDEHAPCVGKGNCLPFKEECVDGFCQLKASGEGEGEGDGGEGEGGEGEGEGEGGEGEGEGGEGEGEGEGAAGEGEGEGGEGEGEGGGCVPAAPTREDPNCPGDLFHADFYDGDCLPDALVGSPGSIAAAADWTTSGGVPGIVVLAHSDGTGQFSTQELARPLRADAQAGFGEAVALDALRSAVAGCAGCRDVLAGEPQPTLSRNTSANVNGQAWFFGVTSPGVFVENAASVGNLAAAGIGTAVARAFTSASTTADAFTFPTTGLSPQGAVSVNGTVVLAGDVAGAGGGSLGTAARNFPDVNISPDGVPDLAVAGVDLADGAATLGVIAFSSTASPPVAVHKWRASSAGESFGVAFADLSDLTCDGKPEIVIGAPDASGGGRAYVDTLWPQTSTSTGPYVAIDAPLALGTDASFGFALEPIGDLDGDHFEELLVGAPFTDAGGAAVDCTGVVRAPAGYAGNCGGAVAIVSGAEIARASAAGDVAVVDPSCVLKGSAGEAFGYALRALGPLAGIMRVAVGAPGTASSSGKVKIVNVELSSAGVCTFNSSIVLQRASPLPGDRFGFAIAQ